MARGGNNADEVLYGQHSRSVQAVGRSDRLGDGTPDEVIIKLPTIRMSQDIAGEENQRMLSCSILKDLVSIEHDEDTAVDVIEKLLRDGRYVVDTGMSDQSLVYWVEDRRGLEAQVQIYYEDQDYLFGDFDKELIYH